MDKIKIERLETFKDKEFQRMFKKYFEEFEIEVSDYDKLFTSMEDDKRTRTLLLEIDSYKVGFIMYQEEVNEHWFIKEKFGFIRELWIDKDYRHRGYAQSLVNKVENYFIAADIFKVILTTDSADSFYMRLGYTLSQSYTAKNEDRVYAKELRKLEVRETQKKDCKLVMDLWNDGDVMKYVGFPDGLNISEEQINKWYEQIQDKPNVKHYSIFLNNLYCGETFYSVDEKKYAALDIKLYNYSRKQNIAYESLQIAISEAFEYSDAEIVYVDPNVENIAALKLYDRLGFKEDKIPQHLDVADTFRIIRKEDWKQ